ncbi:TPA: AAA family ATPase [Vibrio parahaemolyticus]|nr:AAA family ATPase [Vibrio parahaemolyticus]
MSENQEQQVSVFSPINGNTRVRAIHYYSKPDPLDFVFSGVLAGSVAAIVAPGSTGKGFFSLGVCFDMYTGQNKLGLDIPKLEAGGRVAFVTAEDQADVIGHRIHSLIKHYNMSSDDVVLMDETVHFISLTGEIILNLVDGQGNVNYTLANQMINEYKGYRLIFMDTLARTHTANENDNGDMTTLISVFEYIAKNTGAAFVFIHHTNKGATLNGQGDSAGAARGAASITDNIRCQLNLSKVTQEEAADMNLAESERHKYLWLHNSKVNYSETNPAKLMVRGEGGVLSAYKNPHSYAEGAKICQFQKG